MKLRIIIRLAMIMDYLNVDSRVQMYVWKVVRVVLCLNVHIRTMYIHAKCVYVGIYTCIVKVCTCTFCMTHTVHV